MQGPRCGHPAFLFLTGGESGHCSSPDTLGISPAFLIENAVQRAQISTEIDRAPADEPKSHFMTDKKYQELVKLSRFLSARRSQIMDAWREASDADPRQTTADLLSRSEFRDHIPMLLDALEKKLLARPGGSSEREAEKEQKTAETQHGIWRWRQGYRLTEMTREWGHLHLCLNRELEGFAEENPGLDPGLLAEARREVIMVINEAMNESLAQYVKMEKEEATNRARGLELALGEFEEMDRQRGELIRQVVHDLGGSVQAVTTAAGMLGGPQLTDQKRAAMAGAVERGARTLRMMLGELTGLARLDTGEKPAEWVAFDASKLLSDVIEVSAPVAEECGLWLRPQGPKILNVEGDAEKTRRIIQNLLQNALKYTKAGGVEVTWGADNSEDWWVMVKDTGPGLDESSSEHATRLPGDADCKNSPGGGETAGRVRSEQQKSPTNRFVPGEGIGLVIVKRLCDLLGATFEIVESSPRGLTVRVVFPNSLRVGKN